MGGDIYVFYANHGEGSHSNNIGHKLDRNTQLDIISCTCDIARALFPSGSYSNHSGIRLEAFRKKKKTECIDVTRAAPFAIIATYMSSGYSGWSRDTNTIFYKFLTNNDWTYNNEFLMTWIRFDSQCWKNERSL